MARGWLGVCLAMAVMSLGSEAVAAPAPETGGDGQPPELSIDEMLLYTQTSVAAKKPQTTRDAPGIVTIVTRDEIQASGARDLIDVLQLVPGFFFALDVQGVVGFGMRGNFAHEGKILLLVDGQEMNEIDYSTMPLGHHFPVEHIQRVEVIRGPGSAIYGGYAELAVVNVVTRSGEELKGASAAAYYGQTPAGLARRGLALSLGQKAGDVEVSFAGLVGQGNRSDQDFVDRMGGSYNLEGQSALDPRWVNLGVRWRELRLRLIGDGYRMTTRDAFGEPEAQAFEQAFSGFYSELSYALRIGKALTVTPLVSYKRQYPWHVSDQASVLYTERYVERLRAGVTASYDVLEPLNVLVGVEGYQDTGKVTNPATIGIGLQTDNGNGRLRVRYQNFSAYAQGLYQGVVNVTAGARYEAHSEYGDSFVPRFALTKVYGPVHGKLLVSRAFRGPGIQNIRLNDAITPERTTVFEAEAGVQLGEHVFLAANLFDITIDDPIVYTSTTDASGALVEQYANLDQTGSRGVEVEGRLRHPRVQATLGYSFYSAAGKNKVVPYEVPGSTSQLLAAPQHKLTLSSSIKIIGGLSANPSLIALSDRAFVSSLGDDLGAPKTIGKLDAALLLNLYLSYRDLGLKGLDVGAGVYNLLDQRVPFPQAYAADHNPLPSQSIEVLGKVGYTLGF